MGKKLPFLTRPIVVAHTRNAQNKFEYEIIQSFYLD
jgi:hypothetical protein